MAGSSEFMAGQYCEPGGDNFDSDSNLPAGIDLNSFSDPVSSEELLSQYVEELKQIEDEIQTLRQVLSAKTRRQRFLKERLGLTVMSELRSGVHKGMDNLRSTEAYQKTTAVMKTAKEKTSAALQDKWNILKQSNAFKSFEDKLGSAYSSVKWPSAATQLAVSGPASVMGRLVRSSTISGEPSISDFCKTQNSNPDPGHAAIELSTEPTSTVNLTPIRYSSPTEPLQAASLCLHEESDETEEFVQPTQTTSFS